MIADRLFFSAMVIIPLLIMLAAGYALRYEKLDVIPVAFADEDGSRYSGLLYERLSGKEGLDLKAVTREEAMKLLDGSSVEQVFIVKKGFEESVKKGDGSGMIELLSSPSSYSSGVTQELVAGEVTRLITANMAANSVAEQYRELGLNMAGSFRDEVEAFAEGLWEPEPLMTIEYKELKSGELTEVSRRVLPASSASSAGLIMAFIMFYMLFGSGWLIEERVNGTIKRLGAGNGALAASFKGSILALFAAGTLQILMICLVLKIFFNISLFAGVLSYLVLGAYLLAIIAISLFLSSILKTPAQLQAGAPVLALMTGFAGGCFWNFAEMPEEITRLSLFTPQGWALKGINSLLLNPADAAAALAPLLVLFTTALILLPLSYMIINVDFTGKNRFRA